jgi:3D (Asp-Asp-Asp) domain-containing protein
MRDDRRPRVAGLEERRKRPDRIVTTGAAVALLCIGTAATVGVRSSRAVRDVPVAGIVVSGPAAPSPVAPLRLEGVLVRGAGRDWAVGRTRLVRKGEPVPVQLTAYCLQGTTRRDNPVREGIVAADPRIFPLGGYVEVYVGRKYHGRFLIDDTGGVIREGILDIWTPSCREARRFGRRRGIAVVVARPRGAHPDTLLTGRLSGITTR